MRRSWQSQYYAMYSSLWEGIVTDPILMSVPVDDHMVHRGDGVFETFKCIHGCFYNAQAHLSRLQACAARISLPLPAPVESIGELAQATTRAGGRRDALVRLFISRGPGSLGISPYDCPQPALYIVAGHLAAPFMEAHPRGATVIASRVPIKPSAFAVIKSVNYLPNVLMKKEAVDAGVDFVLGFDEQGHMAEGATENFAIVTPEGWLKTPRLHHILAGTTMLRVLELARTLVDQGRLRGIMAVDIPYAEVAAAAEMLVLGTTPNVTAAIQFDGQPVASGQPGPVYAALSRLLNEDMAHNQELLTPVFPVDQPPA